MHTAAESQSPSELDTPRSRRTWIIAGAVVAILATIAATRAIGGRGSQQQGPPPAPQVTVAAAVGRPVTDWDEFTGHLESVDMVDVRPRVSGYVERVAFTEGTMVHKGDVLFIIDQRPYAADVEKAKADLAQAETRRTLAQSEVARAKHLLTAQAISRQDFDTRTSASAEGDAAVQAAQAALTTAELNLEWTTVRAPITGRVGRAQVTPGNLVQAGAANATPLTTVVSLDPIYVYFDGDEQTYLKDLGLAPQAGAHGVQQAAKRTVFMGLADETGYPHEGHIDFVDNKLDPVAGTIRARAVFTNADHRLTPGLFARIKLVGSHSYQATLIRDDAVGTDQDRKFVFVLKPDNSVDYRAITLGPMDDGLRVVKHGLTPGERVVVNGLQRVRPGVKVNPTVVPMTPPSDSQPAVASTH
ncbi:MAG: efflux RND transporter periplasmic adaptor subunit [Gemmatimonadaceae bacterium]